MRQTQILSGLRFIRTSQAVNKVGQLMMLTIISLHLFKIHQVYTKMGSFRTPLVAAVIMSLSIVNVQSQTVKRNKLPNFVILLVDDLGIGDVGCYGNATIRTPSIDQIAKEGAKLEHNISPESICSPSRGAFLTGRYPIRQGLASRAGSIRTFINTAVQGGLPGNETTFAKILQKKGYKTGFIGKWHLGISHHRNDFVHHPHNHGFDLFYGLPLTNLRDCGDDSATVFSHVVPQLVRLFSGMMLSLSVATLVLILMIKPPLYRLLTIFLALFCTCCVGMLATLTFYRVFNCFLMRGFDVVEQPVYLKDLTQRFVTEAVQFIKQNKNQQFLLFLSFAKVHTALFTTDAFANSSKYGKYGDNVEEMDWAVGQIMKSIHDYSSKNDTFVYMTSDNGPHLEEVAEDGEYHAGWRGKYRGGKGMSWEGGIRVPTLAMWPGMIPSGTIVTEPTGSIDVFRTIVELANASVPQDRLIDSKNIFPLLQGHNVLSPHEFIYHYCGSSLQAITYRPRVLHRVWKAHFTTPKWTPNTTACFGSAVCGCHGDHVNTHNPPLLFSLTDDPEEAYPLDPNLLDSKTLINTIVNATKSHTSSIRTVPDQMELTYWMPQLQMCCNFPFCYCKERYPYPLIPVVD